MSWTGWGARGSNGITDQYEVGRFLGESEYQLLRREGHTHRLAHCVGKCVQAGAGPVMKGTLGFRLHRCRGWRERSGKEFGLEPERKLQMPPGAGINGRNWLLFAF